MPSAAMKSSLLCLNLYGSLKSTLARGAPRPGSWMISYKFVVLRLSINMKKFLLVFNATTKIPGEGIGDPDSLAIKIDDDDIP